MIKFDKGYALAKIIRRMIFVEEQLEQTAMTPECTRLWSQEILDDDGTCQHVVGFLGDMPVAAGRSRILSHNDGSRMVKFDRMCVLARYRRRGIFSKMLRYMLSEWSKERAGTLNVGKCLVCCPVHLARHLQRLLLSLEFQQTGQQYVNDRDIAVVPLVKHFTVS